MGKPTALAASTFVAYLLGSVLEVHATTVSRGLRKARSRYFGWLQKRSERRRIRNATGAAGRPRNDAFLQMMAAEAELTKPAVDTLAAYVADRTGQSKGTTTADLARGFSPLLRDLPQLRTRLYAANKDLYGDYDRLAAEADLKVNVGGAAIALNCVAASVMDPWWALLCLPMAFLIYRGLSMARQANDVLVQAIVTDVVKSPKFEEYITAELSNKQGNTAAPTTMRAQFRSMWDLLSRRTIQADREATPPSD
ncbi:hypothetical protein [Streptomyces sp. NPDC050287]|uniref:hypothetical protein n=1 Tax=Streptomyces sp. NPDC050287 TaxID=3365608 RepID=UPI0037A7B5C0